MDKDCTLCFYHNKSVDEDPCFTCENGDRWRSNNIINTKLMNTSDPIFLPCRKHPNDGGADLRARISGKIVLYPQTGCRIPTGIAVEIPEGYVGDVRPRSGAAAEGKVAMYGTIDCGYTGEISLNIFNISRVAVTIEPKERLAQLVVLPYLAAEFNPVDELSKSDRGENGFGSTGKL